MISHNDFHSLKLKNFYARTDIEIVSSYEYMDELWCGETLGFTAFLALKNDPSNTRCLTLDLSYPEGQLYSDIFAQIGLKLRAGLSSVELESMYGNANEIFQFQNDRLTYEYHLEGINPYSLSCTVHNSKGLIFVTISCAV